MENLTGRYYNSSKILVNSTKVGSIRVYNVGVVLDPWECNGHCNEILHLTPDVPVVRVLKM
jgi:hypothetical protein